MPRIYIHTQLIYNMKKVHFKLVLLLSTLLTLPYFAISQDEPTFELSYEVHRVYPSLSITRTQLNDACTLLDLNQYYKPSWVKEYISVEILTSHEGKITKAVSEDDTLSQIQKEVMAVADAGTDITVKIRYIPNNNLKYNEEKEMDFKFTVEPENEAAYSGGQQRLTQYIKENATSKISDDVFNIYQLTAVKFTIDEEGQVVDAHVFESSKDEQTDELLLEAVRNMPNWKPATYANGMKVKQEFVLTAGDHRSCVINLLNVRR